MKLTAVLAAEAAGVVAAERQTGIPESTIRYWMEKPEFAQIRAKAREDLAEEYKVAAHVLTARVMELAPTMEARDAIAATETFAKLMQLLTGHATERTEKRDITDTIPPEYEDDLADALDEWLAEAKAKKAQA